MSMRVTVVGSAGTNPSAERVCSSYLVVADGDMDTFAPVVDRLAGR